MADRSFQRTASTTELAQLQRRTSTTELSEFERTALHTELAELERPALTTELAPLQTSSFGESNFELIFQKPSFTAQLCLGEATSLGGAQLRTAELQRGMLSSSQLASLQLDTEGLMPQFRGSSFASLPRRKLACTAAYQNQVSLVRIHFSHPESDGKSADVGGGGRIGILIFPFRKRPDVVLRIV